MKGSPLKVNTFNENVLSGLGQKAASPGWLREVSWQPRFNQGGIGAWNNNVGGNLANINPAPSFNLFTPGGNFFISPATSSGSTAVQGTLPIEVASDGQTPPTYTVSMSSTAGDYGSGPGSVGRAISDTVENETGGVGFDLLILLGAPSEVTMSSTASTDITVRAFKYSCQRMLLTTEGTNTPSYAGDLTGSFYDFYFENSTTLIDNEPTTGDVATLTRRPYDALTIVLGRKFNGGAGYAANSWFGAALPNFNVACS